MSVLAIASLVLSLASLLVGPFGFVPGLVCGHLARSACRRDPSVDGAGIALAGLIVGYVALVINLLLLLGVMLLILLSSSPTAPFVYTMF